MGHYSCEFISCVSKPKKTSEISNDLLKWATDFTKQQDPWIEATVKVRIEKGASYTEIQKDPTVVNATLQCLEKSNAYESLSYFYFRKKKKKEKKNRKKKALPLLGHKDSKLMYFDLSIKGAGAKESCRFKIKV